MLKTIDTDMTPFPHLNWKLILKVSSPLVSSEAELQNIKASPAVFGVWGKEKWEYFSEFLDNVWDVSSDVIKEVLDDRKDDPEINILNRISVNIGELVVAILKKHVGDVFNPLSVSHVFLRRPWTIP
ncbi:hypothetical protein AVEN_136478-1 [Araneus ventricosus]|uniref:Uncharacterized protein n=1 Tax=Araneus ventricosus TaxID=182803 RepID=A0A4Y2QG75_ARAVE|nr:hypothetical protein AVEN_136478-1 [Araneus ventricosus]